MLYRKMGKSDLEVSVIGEGTWPFGGDVFGEVDTAQAIRAIHAAVDCGINLIDQR